MLNRRSLRIKVMQSLFAFHQSKEANYLLCRDQVEHAFTPDLNSMEVQDKKLLAVLRKEALALYDAHFPDIQHAATDNEKIASVMSDSADFYKNAIQRDFARCKSALIQDVEKIYHHYLSVLALAAALAEAAEADKKINHSNFVQNAWIVALRNSEVLQQEADQKKVSWGNRMDKIRSWLRDVIKQDAEYMTFLDKKAPTREEQKKIVNHFFRRIILGKTLINDYFEEEVLYWTEDREIVRGMVEKTVKSFSPESGEPLQLHTLSLNWDDDLDFIEKLFQGAAHLDAEHQALIAANTRNWEVERLPLTDRAILELAITEMVSFPSIPVKVTINEYIELAKNYSTPKSRQFINGILDVIARELKSKGAIRKSGRGLMDNK